MLVAEDRSLIAAKVAQILCRADCLPVGPVATLKAGLDLVRQEDILLDAAVLDIDLRGEPVYPLAEVLRARGIPFLFLTGYGALIIPDPWRGAARVQKPFDAAALLRTLRSVIAGHRTRPATRDGFDGVQPSRMVRQAWETIRGSRDLITEGRILIERGGPGQKR